MPDAPTGGSPDDRLTPAQRRAALQFVDGRSIDMDREFWWSSAPETEMHMEPEVVELVRDGLDYYMSRVATLTEEVQRLRERYAPIEDELARAMSKFPTWPTDPAHAFLVLAEEVGELAKAITQEIYEPHKNDDGDVRAEATESAAMAVRLLTSLGRYRFTPCEQHEQLQSAPTPEGP